jgi:hypothetical protein
MSQDMDNFMFSILLKQQQNSLKTNKSGVLGQSNTVIEQDAVTR